MAQSKLPDLGKRLLVAVPLATFYAFSCMYDGLLRLPLLVALLAFSLATLRDYYRLARRGAGEAPFEVIGYAFACCLILMSWNEGFRTAPDFASLPAALHRLSDCLRLDANSLSLFLIVFGFAGLGAALRRGGPQGATYSSSVTIFGVFYAVLPICHVPLLLNLKDGIFWGWLVSWCIFMSDTAAYLAGRLWGRRHAGFIASPNKTLEGYYGGLVLAVVFAFAFYLPAKLVFAVPELPWYAVLAIAITIYLLCIFGDLVESVIKRDNQRKDAGLYLPGHGGLLDIVDSFLLVLPLSYHFIRVVQSWRA